MSYMRLPYYIYATGKDANDSGARLVMSGDALPMHVFDQLVAMRAAELVEEGRFEQVAREAVEEHGGNIGTWALQRALGGDPEAKWLGVIVRSLHPARSGLSRAPWTEAQVASLRHRQTVGHPYTCPNHFDRALVPMAEHLACEVCNYRQKWVHVGDVGSSPGAE